MGSQLLPILVSARGGQVSRGSDDATLLRQQAGREKARVGGLPALQTQVNKRVFCLDYSAQDSRCSDSPDTGTQGMRLKKVLDESAMTEMTSR